MDNAQGQTHSVNIQGAAFSRLNNDDQVKELIKDAEKRFNFYNGEIKNLQGRVDGIKKSIIQKDIAS